MLVWILIVIGAYGLVHFFEILAFYGRKSGVASNNTAMGYALQSSVFMVTRFFTMALFPVLGYIVDSRIDVVDYLLMMSGALLLAGIFGIVVMTYRGRVVHAFELILSAYKMKGQLVREMILFPRYFFLKNKSHISIAEKITKNNYFFFCGVVIFGTYSISVLLSFFFGLLFYDYRVTISQMSGMTNAFATVLLTFYVEPKLSLLIDSDKERAQSSLDSLMAGRVFGTIAIGIIVLIISIFLM